MYISGPLINLSLAFMLITLSVIEFSGSQKTTVGLKTFYKLV